jgi:hypothetical protein
MQNKINIKFSGRDIYIEKMGIIQDKKCRNCNKLILKEQDFCECGFFLKAEKDSVFWSLTFISFIFIYFIILFAIISYNNIKYITSTEIKTQKTNLNSLSPINIQIITSLKNSQYYDYIQNIYIKQGTDNVLLILIKPSFWDLLSKENKQKLLNLVIIHWKIIYKQKYPLSKRSPIVKFANPE